MVINHATTVVTAASQYGTGGLTQWLKDNVITLVILLLGIAVLWAARSGNLAKAVTIVGGVIIGIAVLALASGNNANSLGNFIVDLFKG